MITNFIKFEHFTSIKNYCFLQSHFEAHDVSGPGFEKREKPTQDIEINDYEFDEFQNADQTKIYFVEDFVVPGLNNIHQRYFDNFRKEIENKGLYSKDLLDGFCMNYYDKMSKAKKLIQCADYLSLKIKVTVLARLDSLFDLIEGYIKDPYPHISNKIKFNWQRVEIIYFFNLLRANKNIQFIADNDLGRILDSCFEYYNKQEKIHKPITKSRKHLAEFKNSKRSSQTVNEALKEKLQDDDFFNH